MRFVTTKLTPEMAKQFLETQCKNRKVNWSKVTEMVRIMKAGNFIMTHQGLAINPEGRMFDGQHRCHAVILSGVTIDVLIAYDADEATYKFLDLGEKRTAADILSIKGYDSVTVRAAIAKQVILYQQGRIGNSLPVSPHEVSKFADSNYESLTLAVAAAIKVKTYPSAIGAVYFIFSNLPVTDAKQKADAFITGLADGVNLEKDSAVLRLREKLLDRPKGGKFYHNDVIAWTFKAMNAHFRNEKLRSLKPSDDVEKRFTVFGLTYKDWQNVINGNRLKDFLPVGTDRKSAYFQS